MPCRTTQKLGYVVQNFFHKPKTMNVFKKKQPVPLSVDEFHHVVSGRPGMDDIAIHGSFRVQKQGYESDAVTFTDASVSLIFELDFATSFNTNVILFRKDISLLSSHPSVAHIRTNNMPATITSGTGKVFDFVMLIPAQEAVRSVPNIVVSSAFAVSIRLQATIWGITIHSPTISFTAGSLPPISDKYPKDSVLKFTKALTWPYFYPPHIPMIENRSNVDVEISRALIVSLDFPPLIIPERAYELKYQLRTPSGGNGRQIQKIWITFVEQSQAHDTVNYAMEESKTIITRTQHILELIKDINSAPAWVQPTPVAFRILAKTSSNKESAGKTTFNPSGVFSTIRVYHFLRITVLQSGAFAKAVSSDIPISVTGFTNRSIPILFDPPVANVTRRPITGANPNVLAAMNNTVPPWMMNPAFYTNEQDDGMARAIRESLAPQPQRVDRYNGGINGEFNEDEAMALALSLSESDAAAAAAFETPETNTNASEAKPEVSAVAADDRDPFSDVYHAEVVGGSSSTASAQYASSSSASAVAGPSGIRA
ncbi:hypothetical protein BJ742DRAFT_322357 [Cladochytrium replicatum]|nr:hypothetical protein BJ742DRAFT_322357 [Cladochytrium replicatum]